MTSRHIPQKLATTSAIFVCVVLAGLLYAASAGAQTAAGSITALTGTVNVIRAGATLRATYGMPVNVGDRITTGRNGRATITLTDNSQLELTESSSLTITQQTLAPGGGRAATRVSLFGGLMRSLVRVTPGTPPNFEVHTPNAVASARGTMYDTQYQTGVNREGFPHCNQFTDVSVYDGTVEVSNPTNPGAPPVQVPSGHKTTVPCAGAPLPASSISGAAAGAGAAAGTGSGLAHTTGLVLGTGIVVGGTVGGIAAAGGFGGGNGNGNSGGGNHPISPSQ